MSIALDRRSPFLYNRKNRDGPRRGEKQRKTPQSLVRSGFPGFFPTGERGPEKIFLKNFQKK